MPKEVRETDAYKAAHVDLHLERLAPTSRSSW